MDRDEKLKLKPIIKRRRQSYNEILADQEGDILQVIQESEELIFDYKPKEFVDDLCNQIDSTKIETREQAIGVIIGLKIEHAKDYIIALLDSPIIDKLLEAFQFFKDRNALLAIKRIAKLAIKGDLEQMLEVKLKSISLIDKLAGLILTSITISKTIDKNMIVTAEILVFLLENSTEWFLKDLFLSELSNTRIIDSLNNSLRLAGDLEESHESYLFMSLVYQVFQVATEIKDIALKVVTSKSLYKHLIDFPKPGKYNKDGTERRENYLIYLDKMLILLNLTQYFAEIEELSDREMDLRGKEEFEEKIKEFFSFERFANLKSQLLQQKRSNFIDTLMNSRKDMIEEFKEKKSRKQRKELEKNFRSEWIDMLENDKQVFIVLARLYETGSDSSPEVLNVARMNLLIDDEFYELIHNVDLDRETLELLFSFPDILENKVYFEEFNINYFSFLANYLIFMYESPTGSCQLQDFDFQMLQYLTIQLKNLVDFTYRMHEGRRMHLCLDKRVPKKMVECILIIIDNINPLKMENYLAFCDPVTWNKIMKIFDQVYQSELDFMAELIEITSKLYNPAFFTIDSKEKEFSFEEHIEILKKVLTTSPDTFLIAAAVDGLIDIFSNEAYDVHFVRHEIFKLLTKGMSTFIEEVRKKMLDSPDEDTSRLSDVVQNLPQFLDYKAKNTRF